MLTVDYWSISLKDLSKSAALYQLLSVDEQGRSQRFKFPELQQRFVLSRAALRQILGFYLKQNPAAIIFEYGKYGKPFVKGISFNFSHTKELALCAVVAENDSIEVGIDVEAKDRNTNALSLAERFFDRTEYQYLQQISKEAQRDCFLHFWTAKEAYLKAKGTGLQGGLDQAVVILEPQPQLQIPDAENWSLQIFQVDAKHWGAIAINSPHCEFTNRGEWMV